MVRTDPHEVIQALLGKSWSVYCPAALVGIAGLNRVTGDRTISVGFIRGDRRLRDRLHLPAGLHEEPCEIRDALLPILELPAISLSGKPIVREALRLYVEAGLPFADAYHAALMADFGLREIYTFGRHFDRCPGITRLTP